MSSSVDVSGFVAMVRDLARMSGKDFEPVLLLSVGQLLKACINRTPARKEGMIAKRVSAHGGYVKFADGTIIQTLKKRNHEIFFLSPSNWDPRKNPKQAPPKLVNGMARHIMNDPQRRWNSARWSLYQEHLAQRTVIMRDEYKRRLAARGLAKRTWWQIAESLGLDPSIAAPYVRNAKSPDGIERMEGTARKVFEAAAAYIEISNANRIFTERLDGMAILQGALRDRKKAFDIDVQKGVFADIVRRAQRYPGIFVN